VLDRRLDGPPEAPIALALSGGGDSVALLTVALAWAKPRNRTILALTVDHGLNVDSAAWTAGAGALARRLGADWTGLSWLGEKPRFNLQAKARTARHALLGEAARAAGARVILMGHTADDVGEATLMRAQDMPGFGRVREWSPSPVWPEGRGIFLLRPLLWSARASLRAYLRAAGLGWLDDPANGDTRFARVRARQALKRDESLIANAAPLQEFDPVLARSVSFAPGTARAPLAPFSAAPDRIAAHLLSTLLLSVSGRSTPPRTQQLDHVRRAIKERRATTLAGCRIAVKDEVIAIEREKARGAAAPEPLEPVRWTASRFYAANGVFASERDIPLLD